MFGRFKFYQVLISAGTFQLNNQRLIRCLYLATCSAWLTLYLVNGYAGKVNHVDIK